MPRKPECSTCGKVKERPNAAYCNACQATYRRTHYEANKAAYIERANARSQVVRRQLRDEIQRLKEGKQCVDCGTTYPPWVLQFDHLSGKEFQISDFATLGCSVARLHAEVAKCEIVCANCHAERTYRRRHAGVDQW